jgi:cytochrome P450
MLRRITSQDTVLGSKWWIPAGTSVWLPWAVLHESNINYLRPTEFLPERWLSEEGAAAAAVSATVAKGGQEAGGPTLVGNAANLGKSWLPFSDGPRSCLGMAQAAMNMRAVLMVSGFACAPGRRIGEIVGAAMGWEHFCGIALRIHSHFALLTAGQL